MPMNLKGSMNYSCLIISLPAISSNFIFFFCTDLCTSRDLIEQITESSELDFLERSTLYKNKLKQGSHTLKACYRNDQAEKRKITNAYKFFFFLSLRATGMMLSLQMVRFQTRSLLRISVTLQFSLSRVY